MAVETLNGVPCKIEAGNTVPFSVTFTDFPTASWAATFYLSLNGTAVLNTAAVETGGAYVFTLAAASTSGLALGIYDWAIYVTSGSERTTAATGQLTILPNLAVSQTPSQAQAMVTLLENALAALAATTKMSVNFNGQSFTRANIQQYNDQLVYWQAQLQKEKDQLAALRGKSKGRTYAPRFGSGGNGYPFGDPFCRC